MVHRQSYEQLRKAYREGTLSPIDVAKSALAHAESVNETLNAFALIDHERALSLAGEAEQRWKSGSPLSPIDGMPITVKEFAAIEGWPTRRGSTVTPDTPAAQSAVFVDRLLNAGAVLIGKTRAPEFNWKGVTDSPGYGVTRNPLDPNLTPGGSSGGCSAAVAAGVVRVSLGSDAGGSVRIPAAFTGTVALKPTYGRIPLVPPPSAFSHIVNVGPIAASVCEMNEVMSIVAGPDAGDWSSVGLYEYAFDSMASARGLRIGVLESSRWEECDPAVKQGMAEAIEILKASEFELRTVDYDVKRASQVAEYFYILGARAAVMATPENLRDQVDPDLLRFIEPLADTSLADYMKMQQARDTIAAELHQILNSVDVLILPTLPILPFQAGQETPSGWAENGWMSWNPYTPAFNLAQMPALSFPIWPKDAALPMGLQLVAARGRDDVVVSLASWFEQQLPIQLKV